MPRNGELVWVVGFTPTAGGGVGGFDWYHTHGYAVGRFVDRILTGDENDALTLVPLRVPEGLQPDEITNWISERPHLVEVGLEEEQGEYVVLQRGDDGPNPIGRFGSPEEAERYAEWAADHNGLDHEVVAITSPSPLYPAGA